MATALAPVKPNGNGHQELAEYDPAGFVVPGMENVTPQELRIPILKLVQAQSKMDGAGEHLGEYHNSVTNEFISIPEVLIIGVAKGRVMFPDEYNAENKPVCGSDDGKTPREEYVGKEIKQIVTNVDTGKKQINILVIPKACEGCPFSEWGADGKPPTCSETNTFAGVDKEGMPAVFQLKSAGMKAAASLKTLVAANGIRKTIRIGSAKESDKKGVYYVSVFTPGNKPDKDWQQTAMRLMTSVGNIAARNQQAAAEMDYRQAGPAEGAPMFEGAPEEPPEDLPF